MKIIEEENEIRWLLTECMSKFEGGEIREDYETPYLHWIIEEVTGMLKRYIQLIDDKEETRNVIDELTSIINKGDELNE